MDIVGLVEELPPDRIVNLFESIVLEEQMRNDAVEDDGRNKFKGYMRKLRIGGTISRSEFADGEVTSPIPATNTNGWTRDANTRQPPRYVEPTEDGYPGLEAPVG